MALRQAPLRGPNIILCEGPHDAAFFKALLNQRHINGYEVLTPIDEDLDGGKTQFTAALNSYTTDSGFQNIEGIIVTSDSDANPTASLHAVTNAIGATDPIDVATGSRYQVPVSARSRTHGRPAIGILLIPWEDQPGNLETLLLGAIRPEWRPQHQCAEALMRCVGANQWPVGKQSKLLLHALIAGAYRRRPDLSLAKLWNQFPDLISLNDHHFRNVAHYLSTFPNMQPS